MVAIESTRKQLLRLAQMQGFPQVAEALRELLKAAEQAPDLGTLEKAITSALETATSESRCPMPADLRRLIHEATRRAQNDWYWKPEYDPDATLPSEADRAAIAELGRKLGFSENGTPARSRRRDLQTIEDYLCSK